MRDLLNQQREEGLNRYEQAELETLEKKAGQNFMRFYDETKTQPKFTLDQQQTGGSPARTEQMALLSRTSSPADRLDAPEGEVRDALKKAVEARQAQFAALKSGFDAKLRAVSAALPDATPILAPLKGIKRALEKLWAKREKAKVFAKQGLKGASETAKIGHLAGTLGDILRGSIIVDTIDQRSLALQELAQAFGEENVRIKDDRFETPLPSGYSDIQIEITVGHGMQAELQIHIPEMLAAKEGNGVKAMDVPERYWPENLGIEGLDPSKPGHHHYEIERDPNKSADEQAEATAFMLRLYGNAKAAYEKRTQTLMALS